MKTLYIHGLDSSPLPEKLQILHDLGLDLVASHTDYRHTPDAYNQLLDLAKINDVHFIIGSSLGGLIGSHIANQLKIPCLLFNPAFNFNKFKLALPQTSFENCPLRMVVLGATDDVVDHEKTIQFLESNQINANQQLIVVSRWLGHQIDLRTFKSSVAWAIQNLDLA